jgi:O-antigen ligase
VSNYREALRRGSMTSLIARPPWPSAGLIPSVLLAVTSGVLASFGNVRLALALVAAVLLAMAYTWRPVLVPLLYAGSDTILHPIASLASFNILLSDVIWLPALPLLLTIRSSRSFVPVRWPLYALLVFGGIGTLRATDPTRAVVGMLQFLELLLIAVLTLASLKDVGDVRRVLGGVYFFIVVDAVLGVGQIARLVPIATIATSPGDDLGRISGVSGNALGTYLVLGLAFALSFRVARPPTKRAPGILSASVLGVALLATGIRSAWISFGVVLVTLAFLGLRRRNNPLASKLIVTGFAVIVLVVAALGALLVMPSDSKYVARLASVGTFNQEAVGSTTYTRLQLWSTTERMIVAHPAFGVGRKNWVVARYEAGLPQVVVGLSTLGFSDPHHVWLEVASEQGILGLLAYLWLFVVAARLSWRGLRYQTWPADIALPLLLVSVARPCAELLGGDVGTEKLWFMALTLVLAMTSFEASTTSYSLPSTSLSRTGQRAHQPSRSASS